MKKISKIIFVLCVFSNVSSAQNANPYISINMNPAQVRLGQTAVIEVNAGNFGNDPISPNSLMITLTAGRNAEIKGLSKESDPRWTVKSLNKGAGNTLILDNTGKGHSAFDLAKIYVNITGQSLGGPHVVSANISYINPTGSSKQSGTAQGNATPTDDRSTTSLLVIKSATAKPEIKFKAKADDCYAVLTWEAHMPSVLKIEPEYSTDKNYFGKLSGTPVTDSLDKKLSKLEVEQPNSKRYYRIKVYYKDGSWAYSETEDVETKCIVKKGFTP